MDREAVIRMAREAGFRDTTTPVVALGVSWEQVQCFAALVAAAERNKLAAWMMRQGCATGHGDSTEGLLKELEWQIEESVRNERSACAKVVEDYCGAWDDEGYALAAAIRARGDNE